MSLKLARKRYRKLPLEEVKRPGEEEKRKGGAYGGAFAVGSCDARKKRPAGQLVSRRPITGKPIALRDAPARRVAGFLESAT